MFMLWVFYCNKKCWFSNLPYFGHQLTAAPGKEQKEALEVENLNLSPDLSFISCVTLGPSFLLWETGVMQVSAPSTSLGSFEDQGTKCRSASVQRGLRVPCWIPPLSWDCKSISFVYAFHSIGRDFPEWKEWMPGSTSNVCSGEAGQQGAGNLAILARLCIWTLLLPRALDSEITLLSRIFDAVPSHLFQSKSLVCLLILQTSSTLSPHTCWWCSSAMSSFQPHWPDPSPDPLACPRCHHCLCPTLAALLVTNFLEVSEAFSVCVML